MFLKKLYLTAVLVFAISVFYDSYIRTEEFPPGSPFVYNENTLDNGVKNTAVDVYNRIPRSVWQAFKDEGWVVSITDEPIGHTHTSGESISGLASTSSETVYITNNMQGVNSLYHEMAHFIDYYYEWPSKTEEFERIYEEESGKFHPINCLDWRHQTSSPQEYFASVYAEAMYFPNYCKLMCPKTYEYIENVFLENHCY